MAKSPSLKTLLLADLEHAQVFVDERCQPHVQVKDGDRNLHLPLYSKEFSSFLYRRALALTGEIPARTPVLQVLRMLEAQVRGSARIRLWNRVAKTNDGAIWLDLDNDQGLAAKVTKEGVEILNPPPLFHRYSHQQSLPLPKEPGDLRQLCSFLNIKEERDQMLFLCSLVVALIPDIPQPILILHGPQGAAKTTTARIRRALLDPSEVRTVLVRRDLQELVQALDHHYMPILDNLTSLAPWQSEVLCQAATGAAFTKRALFTNQDDVIASFHRPVVLTGIHLPSATPDLLDRCILIHLPRIAPAFRREESRLWEEFEKQRPHLLYGLLHALSKTLDWSSQLEFSELGRMADFTRYGTASALALGYDGDAFLAALEENNQRQGEGVVEEDPLAQALCTLVRQRGFVIGSTPQILSILRSQGNRSGLPNQEADLVRRLLVLQVPLFELGILIRSCPPNKASPERTWFLAKSVEADDLI